MRRPIFKLNDVINPKEEIVVESLEKELPNNSFTEIQLLEQWKLFLEELKNRNQEILYNVLNTVNCLLKDTQTIHLQFPSHSVYQEFEQYRPLLLERIKSQLNNYHINYSYEIKADNTHYTHSAKDIYNKLREINPLIDKFNQYFNLDL